MFFQVPKENKGLFSTTCTFGLRSIPSTDRKPVLPPLKKVFFTPNCGTWVNNKNGGQYSKTVVFNHGYSINFRIHNASSRVEASLKFDIKAIGLPTSEVYQQTIDLAPNP